MGKKINHILIAPNAFKHVMTADKAAKVIAEGLKESSFKGKISRFPIADGGDGTRKLIHHHLKGVTKRKVVANPLGKEIEASYSLIHEGEIAVIDMAEASGIGLLKREEYNPLMTNSLGTGELIMDALEQRVDKIVLGMGGSATVDGGCGILHALGMRFLDDDGKILKPIPEELMKLKKIDMRLLDPRMKGSECIVLCDVTNPLLGEKGAAKVFAPQKGASEKEVDELEKMLKNLRAVVSDELGREMNVEKGGTAGGAAGGLYALINANLVHGIDYFLDLTNFEEALQNVDLVITGEGSLDEQTLLGKGPYGVVLKAKEHGIPVIGLAGKVPLNPSAELQNAFDVLLSINNEILTLKEALDATSDNLLRMAKNIGNLLSLKN